MAPDIANGGTVDTGADETRVFAIIQSGGHQVKVRPGTTIEVDLFDANPGDEVSIEQVLLVERGEGDVLTGTPFVANARVIGVVQGESRGPKIRVFKKVRRKGSRKSNGHRSTFTRVAIKDIIVT